MWSPSEQKAEEPCMVCGIRVQLNPETQVLDPSRKALLLAWVPTAGGVSHLSHKPGRLVDEDSVQGQDEGQAGVGPGSAAAALGRPRYDPAPQPLPASMYMPVQGPGLRWASSWDHLVSGWPFSRVFFLRG